MEPYDPFEQERRINEALQKAEEATKTNLAVLAEIRKLVDHMDAMKKDVVEVKEMLDAIECEIEKGREEARALAKGNENLLVEGATKTIKNVDGVGHTVVQWLRHLDQKIDAMERNTKESIKKGLGEIAGEVSMNRGGW